MTRLLNSRRPLGRLFCCLIVALLPLAAARAAAPATTLVSDTVYRADGAPAAGTLVIAWNAFTTADDKAVPAGRMTVKIGAGGAVSIPLAPNFGASPEGTYYKVTYKLDDGSTSEEFWSVPAAPSTTISAIRSKLVPANVAVQYATRQYVDSMLAQGGGGTGNATQLQGVDIDATSPVRGQSLVFDGTKYKPQSQAIVDVVRDCGAKGDGVTDDGPVLQTCILNNPGAAIYFPKTQAAGSPDYYVGTPATTYTPAGGVQEKFGLVMSGHGQRLTGDGTGQRGTMIKFAAGITGILIPNSSSTYGAGSSIGCQNCEVDHLSLQGSEPYNVVPLVLQCVIPSAQGTTDNYGDTTSTTTADAVRIAATGGKAHDLWIQWFGRHGIMLDGDSAPPKSAFADFAIVENNWAYENRGSGFYNRGGSDGNQVVFKANVAFANQLDGFYTRAFLGEVHYGDGVHSNHVAVTSGASSFSVSAISNTGNVTTVTLTGNHNLVVGNGVTISGTTNYNGTFIVASVPAANKFTFVQTSPIATENSGTATNASCANTWTAAGSDAADARGIRSVSTGTEITWDHVYYESDNPLAKLVAGNTVIGGGILIDWSVSNPWVLSNFISSGPIFTRHAVASYDSSGNPSGTTTNTSPLFVLKSFNTANDDTVWGAVGGPGVGSQNQRGIWFKNLLDSNDSSTPWWFYCVTQSAVPASNITCPFGISYYQTAESASGTYPPVWVMNSLMLGSSGSVPSGTHRIKIWNTQTNTAPSGTSDNFGVTAAQGDIALNNLGVGQTFGSWRYLGAGVWRAEGPIANDATGTSWTLPTLNVTTLSVGSSAPVANLTLASDSQLPAIAAAGKVAASALPDSQRRRICEVHIGSPGGSALTDADDEPASCFNDYGASLTISAVRCYADAGAPTVQLTRNDSTNILSGSLACGAASWALADGQAGRPSISANSLGNGQWLDVNLVSAGGAAKYLRVVITVAQ